MYVSGHVLFVQLRCSGFDVSVHFLTVSNALRGGCNINVTLMNMAGDGSDKYGGRRVRKGRGDDGGEMGWHEICDGMG